MLVYVAASLKKPLVRCDQMEGKDYLVAPMVMMTEGVHNGSGGPILYTEEELKRSAGPTSNHRPVVVYHPERGGEMISACDPTELTKRKIGLTMNVGFDDAKVKGEAWVDPDRVRAVDERVAQAIENEDMMELSTGVYMELEKAEGEWNGEKYVGIARNILLDHLAVLPDIKGACSIEDGAGFIRVNQEGDVTHIDNVEVTESYVRVPATSKAFKKGSIRTIDISKAKGIKALVGRLAANGKSTTVKTYLFDKDKWTKDDAVKWVEDHKPKGNSAWQLILNELSFDMTRSLLSGALRSKKPNDSDAWIIDVYDEYFVYEEGGKLYRQDYEIKDDSEVTFTGLAKHVEKQVTYIEVSVTNAAWTAKFINDLPDSAFLWVEGGGKKDSEGKTTPRSLRHFPYRDASGKVDLPHLRNALARIPQSKIPAAKKKSLTARAQGILKKTKPTGNVEKGTTMDKEKIVNELIEQDGPFGEEHRDELMGMSEFMLNELVKNQEPEQPAGKPAEEKATEEKPSEAETKDQPAANQTTEQFIKNAPPEIAEVLQAGQDALKAQKAACIEAITANENNVFHKENLETRPLHELQALAKLAGNEQKPPIQLYNYGGQAEAGDGGKVEPMNLRGNQKTA